MSEPIFPVPVVRLVVTDQDGRVLILKRDETSHSKGSWCLPGGKVDYGETVVQAAAKELYEETSLKCRSARFLFYQDSLPPQPGEMHCINLYVECDTEGVLSLNEESSEYAWIGPEEIERYPMVFRNDLGLKRYWREVHRNARFMDESQLR
jgi:8-oxo-dGTP pyrophosphatase MutT (NUDIX family)